MNERYRIFWNVRTRRQLGNDMYRAPTNIARLRRGEVAYIPMGSTTDEPKSSLRDENTSLKLEFKSLHGGIYEETSVARPFHRFDRRASELCWSRIGRGGHYRRMEIL